MICGPLWVPHAVGASVAEATLDTGVPVALSREPPTPIAYVAAKSHAEYPHAGSTDIVPLVATDQHRGTGIVTSEPTEELPPDGSGWQDWKARWGASIGRTRSGAGRRLDHVLGPRERARTPR